MSKFAGYDPNKEELYEVKQDCNPVKSAGHSTMCLTRTALGHPKVRYRDLVLTCDVYQMGDELMVHLYCPKCRHNLSIKSKNKNIYYDKDRELLSVEPFKCTWEMNDELLGDHRAFGFSLCGWNVAIDGGVARDV